MDELYELRKLDEPLDDVIRDEERRMVSEALTEINAPALKPIPDGVLAPGEGYVFASLSNCRAESCSRRIAWWRTPKGKTAPYDLDGISHFATCVAAERFRRPRSDRKEGS